MQISNGLMNRKHSALINYQLIVTIIITVTMMNGGIIIVVLRKTWMGNGNLTLLKTRVNAKKIFIRQITIAAALEQSKFLVRLN